MSNFTFGAPATGNPTFGPAPTTNAPPTFGATPTLNFGATPAISTAPTFGVPATTQLTSLPTLSTGNLGNFGVPNVSVASATVAASTSAPAPTFSFGNTTAIPNTNASALNFSSGLGLGVPATVAATTQPTWGGGNFSFGKTTAAPITGLNTAGNFGLNKPLILPTATATTTAVAATTTTSFIGLGGIDVSATQPKPGDNKQNNVRVKETLVPDEIAKTVDALKAHIKVQKQLSSDIGRTSTSRLTSVSGEISKLQWLLQEIANSVETNYNQIKLLRNETSRTIQSLEMAQRTQDTPAGLQYENQAPFQYFQDLVAKYEQDLINIRQLIVLTERHMQSITSPQTVTPEDLKRGLQQINESFVSLAGRVHEVHQKVEAQKEQFLNLRKYRLRDSSNVFAKLEEPEANSVQNIAVKAGPSPFPHLSAMDSFGRSFATNSAAAAATNK